MTLTIDLSPSEEARLRLAATRAGVAPEDMASKLVSEHLPVASEVPYARLDEKLRTLQTKSGVRLMRHTSITDLYAHWAIEDANMTQQDREEEDRLWQDLEKTLIETPRSLKLRRVE